MNRIARISIVAAVMASMSVGTASAYDWTDLLKKGKESNSTEATDTKQSDGGSSAGSSVLSGLASLIGDATGLNKLTPKDLVGTWNYVQPAVAFQSENFLQKAGGAAAATVIVDKVRPYYQTVGLDKVSFTFKDDGTMSMGVGRLALTGAYSQQEDGSFIFDIQIKGKSIKKMQAFVTRQMKNICVTFDASGLISLINTVANFTGNSTAQGLASVLNSYDGLTVGFELAKQ